MEQLELLLLSIPTEMNHGKIQHGDMSNYAYKWLIGANNA